MSVTDSSAASTTATSGVIGVTLNDGKFLKLTNEPTSATAGGIYSTAEIDTMINGLDGMAFKGTLGSSGSVQSLPTTGVENGDVYVVVQAGLKNVQGSALYGITLENGASLDSSGTVIGDMFIARVTQVSGSTVLKWSYIPSGNDSLDPVTYKTAVTTSTNSLLMTNNVADTGILGLGFSAGSDGDIVISSTKSTQGNTDNTLNVTVGHKAYTTGSNDTALNSIITTATKADKTDTYTAITGLAISNGHITGITK